MTNDREIKIATVFEQSRQNAEQINELRKEFTSAMSEFRNAIDRLGGRLNTAMAPNFSTWIGWAGIILAVIGMVAAPVAYYFNHSIESIDTKLQKEYTLINDTMNQRVSAQKEALIELDSRLQREFNLANEYIRTTATVLKTTWDERHVDLANRVTAIESWNSERVKSDLEELRQRRMNQPQIKP